MKYISVGPTVQVGGNTFSEGVSELLEVRTAMYIGSNEQHDNIRCM